LPETVQATLAGAVLTLTLNRPQARNALNTEMKIALLAALRDAASDAAVRAVVITGAGDGFCAGQDLREHADALATGATAGNTVTEHYNPVITAVVTMPKPVVAAVNGPAAGAGASLAFACDFRLAADRASFVMSFAAVGLGPDSGASWTLQRLAGAGRAAELLMLGAPLPAQQALAYGLLTSVVASGDLAGEAAAMAARLAAGPTAAFAAIKSELRYAASHDLPESLANEAHWQAELSRTADHQAATQAFLRKEKPVYTGR
jgi:2-(1,2-epoxy-1,2-dihydrophenyl)acetyl-CoA isomerase